MNKWAEIDEACSHCPERATVINPQGPNKCKLCQSCYDKWVEE